MYLKLTALAGLLLSTTVLADDYLAPTLDSVGDAQRLRTIDPDCHSVLGAGREGDPRLSGS